MAGSVHQQKGADWWYVRKYHKGHYYSFSWYHGERMESERMALKLLGQIQGDIERGVFNPLKYSKGQSPIAAYLKEWLSLNESRWSPATASTYRSYVTTHLEPYFRDSRVVIQEVRKAVLDRLRLHLVEKGLSGQTAFSIINGCLKSCLHYAWESEVIDHMPPFPRRKDFAIKAEPLRYISLDVQRSIIEAADPEHRPVLWWLALHMRRPSEAISLRKSDYDPERKIFLLRHGQSARKNVDHIKTRDVHELPCHAQMVQILRDMKHAHPFSPFMFTCESSKQPGKQYTKEILNRIWRDACKKVGVSINLYNGTKHSTAQSYVDCGYTPEQTMLVLGSKSMSTVRHYTEMDKVEIRRNLMEKVVPMSEPRQKSQK